MVAEMIEVGIIQPNQSYFSAPVVLVHKKDESCCTCPDYRELNMLTIKDKFPFLPLMNYWMNYMEKFTSPTWIFIQDLIKSECRLKTFQKQHLELMMLIIYFRSFLLALPMHL